MASNETSNKTGDSPSFHLRRGPTGLGRFVNVKGQASGAIQFSHLDAEEKPWLHDLIILHEEYHFLQPWLEWRNP